MRSTYKRFVWRAPRSVNTADCMNEWRYCLKCNKNISILTHFQQYLHSFIQSAMFTGRVARLYVLRMTVKLAYCCVLLLLSSSSSSSFSSPPSRSCSSCIFCCCCSSSCYSTSSRSRSPCPSSSSCSICSCSSCFPCCYCCCCCCCCCSSSFS